jgi:hypothetical protein
VKNSKGSSKGVKKIWIFHRFFQWKMPEKQTIFFIINCAENLESPNQCRWKVAIREIQPVAVARIMQVSSFLTDPEFQIFCLGSCSVCTK